MKYSAPLCMFFISLCNPNISEAENMNVQIKIHTKTMFNIKPFLFFIPSLLIDNVPC